MINFSDLTPKKPKKIKDDKDILEMVHRGQVMMTYIFKFPKLT